MSLFARTGLILQGVAIFACLILVLAWLVPDDALGYIASSSSFILFGGGVDSIAGTGSSSTFFNTSAGGQAVAGVASSSSFIACKGALCDQPAAGTPTSLTLTIESGGTVSFGTLGFQSRVTRTTNLRIDTTNATGYQLSAGRQRAIANVTLASSANPGSVYIDDIGGGIDVFGGLGGSCGAAQWPAASGASTGLGFTVWAASINKDTTCWGAGSTESAIENRYAALQASSAASAFLSATSNSPNPSFASVGYSLEITQLQQATGYSGQVIFTGTTAP
ncbi:MAG: hypothetical protein IT406_03480 [Candidatus Yanofskybacteria bacterium]|nr:hypothetical protein [Candidatus Yanofskybacteria bacterium]